MHKARANTGYLACPHQHRIKHKTREKIEQQNNKLDELLDQKYMHENYFFETLIRYIIRSKLLCACLYDH